MLRINSTTTRAVTAFDVVGLFCIFGMPPYGFMPQLRHAHCNTLHVYCQDNAIFSAKKTNKKTAAQAFTGAAIYPKMQGNHPLYPHSTHYPHFVKHFLPHFRANAFRCRDFLLTFLCFVFCSECTKEDFLQYPSIPCSLFSHSCQRFCSSCLLLMVAQQAQYHFHHT